MEIQPRAFGDVLGQVITMLGKVWRPLLMPALISAVIIAVASYLILTSTGALDFFDLALNDPEALELMPEQELIDLSIDFLMSTLLIGVVASLMYGFVYLVAARAVGEELAQQPSGRSITAVALGMLLTFVVAMVIVSVGSLVGSIFLLIPGIWFANTMSMVAPVIAVEGKGPVAAMRRSFELVRGNWWETFGFLLLIGLIGGTAAQVIQLVAVPVFLVGNVSFAFGITIALAVAVQGLILAAIAVGASVWYVNLRARTDGPYVLEVS